MEMSTIPPAALPVTETQVPASLKARSSGNDSVAARKVAREFEAMFVGMMLKSMRETVGKDKLTGGGRAEETFRSLLDQEYAAQAAQGGGVGLATMIEKELTRNYGSANPPPVKGETNGD